MVARVAFWAAAAGCAPTFAFAADATPGVVSAGSLLQVAGALLLVLGVLLGAAWLLKRLNGLPRTSPGGLRVVGGTALGARERVVIVELKDTWLVLGVAPGRITPLHTCTRPVDATASEPAASPASGATFAAWINRALERRPHA